MLVGRAAVAKVVTELDYGRHRIADLGQHLEREFERINAMLDEGSGRVPKLAMKIADAVSRRWLERSHSPYLAEIDRIAARIARPGAYFLNLSYEWGCTSSVGDSPRCR